MTTKVRSSVAQRCCFKADPFQCDCVTVSSNRRTLCGSMTVTAPSSSTMTGPSRLRPCSSRAQIFFLRSADVYRLAFETKVVETCRRHRRPPSLASQNMQSSSTASFSPSETCWASYQRLQMLKRTRSSTPTLPQPTPSHTYRRRRCTPSYF